VKTSLRFKWIFAIQIFPRDKTTKNSEIIKMLNLAAILIFGFME